MHERMKIANNGIKEVFEGPIGTLVEGLKEYPESIINEIENYARANIRTYAAQSKPGENTEYQYLIRLGKEAYRPQTVIDAIDCEVKRRKALNGK